MTAPCEWLQVVLEMVELRETETARVMLRTMKVFRRMQQDDPERFLRLDKLAGQCAALAPSLPLLCVALMNHGLLTVCRRQACRPVRCPCPCARPCLCPCVALCCGVLMSIGCVGWVLSASACHLRAALNCVLLATPLSPAKVHTLPFTILMQSCHGSLVRLTCVRCSRSNGVVYRPVRNCCAGG